MHQPVTSPTRRTGGVTARLLQVGTALLVLRTVQAVVVGVAHPTGRAGDLALALKIALLVVVVAVPR